MFLNLVFMVTDGHGYVNSSLPPVVPSKSQKHGSHLMAAKTKNPAIFKVVSNKVFSAYKGCYSTALTTFQCFTIILTLSETQEVVE